MLVMGIDPGTAITGYGLVREDEGELALVACGTVTTSAGQPMPDRLATIHSEITGLIDRYAPHAIAVEQLFFSRNVRTALAVGQARGVVLLAAAERDVPVSEYSPLEVKQAVVGYGMAPKAQVQEMVRMLLDLETVPRSDDAADAVAVAVCHLHSARLQDLIAEHDTVGGAS
jgi:crossover junction endodeoxyribonuclease RuvC